MYGKCCMNLPLKSGSEAMQEGHFHQNCQRPDFLSTWQSTYEPSRDGHLSAKLLYSGTFIYGFEVTARA